MTPGKSSRKPASSRRRLTTLDGILEALVYLERTAYLEGLDVVALHIGETLATCRHYARRVRTLQ